MDIYNLTIKDLHQGFKEKKFSAVDVVKIYLDQIKKTDEKIGAFLSIDEEFVLKQAKEADKKIASQNEFSFLMGIPFAVKDNILVEGQKATAASKILENYIAPYDATVIGKLKEKGAIILGKTNLDEFAMGVSTENSAFKITKNPHDLERVAGGSSGGSAASVASNQAVFSLGSDTGGSIRLPASFCGVVGFNPTYGAVSRYGLIAMASSLDQIGPMTKTVQDCKIVFDAIRGKDDFDATSFDFPEKKDEFKGFKDLRIGIPKEYFDKGIDSEVEKIIRQAIKKAESLGAKIVEISMPATEYAIACYYIIVPSEVSANLARFDGIKYGFSLGRSTMGEPGEAKSTENLLDVYLKSRGEGFGAEPKRRILLGTYALSSGYYDAYYKKAQEVRHLIKQDFNKAFKEVDVIFSPVSPIPAFKVGEKSNDPLSMYLMDIYTCPLKLAGLPAISLPVGKAGNLPVGLQIIANRFEDDKVFAVAEEMEKVL